MLILSPLGQPWYIGVDPFRVAHLAVGPVQLRVTKGNGNPRLDRAAHGAIVLVDLEGERRGGDVVQVRSIRHLNDRFVFHGYPFVRFSERLISDTSADTARNHRVLTATSRALPNNVTVVTMLGSILGFAPAMVILTVTFPLLGHTMAAIR